MNIFYLHEDPVKCAEMHCDKHVVKMIVETSQMLCTTYNETLRRKAPYKSAYVNHPCNVWLRKSLDNYNWLLKLGDNLCKEYTKRYNKTHKCQKVIEWCANHKPKIKSVGLTTRPQVMPDKYKNINAIVAYRNYYLGDKLRFAKWNHSKKPRWVKNEFK